VGRLTDDMKRVVEEQRLAFVATVNADGTPNPSPKGTIAVLDDDHLMFAGLASPRNDREPENLRRNATIELNVVDPETRMGHRFKGRGVVHAEGERFEQLLTTYATGRHPVARPRERIRHIVVIELARCLPLISPA
jgi:predicted pyridoxine 5'-phosphate oxidase superfamily flavin-nucleotide-binding protein